MIETERSVSTVASTRGTLMNAAASTARISLPSGTPFIRNHSSSCSINSESIRPKKERYTKSVPPTKESLHTVGGSTSLAR
jgi:hypothetical protein